MNYWTLDIWSAKNLSQDQFNKHLSLLKTDEYDAIILFCQYEYDFETMHGFKRILNIAFKRDIKIYLFVGTAVQYKHRYNREYVYWPTIFFRQGLIQVVGDNLLLQQNKFIKNLDDNQYKFHFVYLNNKPHYHRSKLIDNVVKNDLLKYSAYSWHKTDQQLISSYSFNYYDNSKKILDEQYATVGTKKQCCMPVEYYQSFFQLVSESTIDTIFVTEKTVTPLLLGKPFLIAGATGIHKKLEDWGFKLYDELFDYSFDLNPNVDERYQAICENIKKITNMSLDECRNYHYIMQDKIIHNRNRVIEIAYNDVPELAKNILKQQDKIEKEINLTILYEEKCLRDIKEFVYNELFSY